MTEETVYALIRESMISRNGLEGAKDQTDNSLNEIRVTKEVFDLLIKQGVESLMANLITKVQCDEALMVKWKCLSAKALMVYMKILTEQQKITDLLKKEQITPIIMKGTSAAMNYPVPQYRRMGDIDIYVAAEKYEQAGKILADAGYKLIHEFDGRHIGYMKNGVIFELHRQFAASSEKVRDSVINARLAEMASKPLLITSEDFSWYSFPVIENGLIFLEHMRHHLASGIGLRQLLDWMMFVHRYMDDGLWEEFKPVAEECGLLKLAVSATKTCVMFLGLPDEYRWADPADEDLCREFMDYIMRKGNLGAEKRSDNTRFIKALNSNGNSLFRLLAFEQASGLVHWKAAKRHKFLHPFAWIYGIGHHIGQMVKDRENLKSISDEMKESRKQRNMLNDLDV